MDCVQPGRRQAITWTNMEMLLIGPLGTNFSEILIEIHTFPFKKMHLKLSSAKWRQFWLALIVLNRIILRAGIPNLYFAEVSSWMPISTLVWVDRTFIYQ